MRYFLLMIILASCTTTLSDEQRKKIHEEMADREIRRITDAELMEGALVLGRKLSATVQDQPPTVNQELTNQLTQWRVRLQWSEPGSMDLREVEQQLIDAYIEGGSKAQVLENLQLLEDTVLYTRPVLTVNTDGSSDFAGTWNFYIPVKSVIQSLDSTKIIKR